jgi:Cytochrome P450
MGDVFGMMFAGHGLCMFYLTAQNEQLMASAETTASTLASTIGLLGLHSDIQEDLYEQIVEVVGHDCEPVSYNVSGIISYCDK